MDNMTETEMLELLMEEFNKTLEKKGYPPMTEQEKENWRRMLAN